MPSSCSISSCIRDVGIFPAGELWSDLHDTDAGDRDTLVNTVAPVWDGNETWLVLGGATLMAAFPLAYSVLLSALYIPIFFMLAGLIWRGVAFEFRFKADEAHRSFWDNAF
jgi:cytochrome d ubiquinol oxidase subunit II